MILALGWSYLHVNGPRRPSLPTHHLETGDGPGYELWKTTGRDLSHLGYRLKAQKVGNFEYLRPTRKTTILRMCNAQGQCCCQNTGPRESAGIVTFWVFLPAVCKHAIFSLLRSRFLRCHALGSVAWHHKKRLRRRLEFVGWFSRRWA